MGYREPSKFENLELFVMGASAIDLQERRGQAELTQSMKLPIQGSDTPEAKACPIKWGEAHDQLFREATLPEGWTKKARPDHAMWSNLVDHKGCDRASIFYKAAFYDCEAFIRFNVRYYAKPHYHNDDSVTFQVYDCGQGVEKVVIYAETPPLPSRETDRDAHYEALAEGEKRAKAWLKERFPNHEDPNAYWDQPAT